MKTFELWFDYSSPYSYLASTQVEALAARTGATLVWRPFLLGGLFKLIEGPDVPMNTWPAAKRLHAVRDMERWAEAYGVPFRFPARFPMSTLTALRVALSAPEHLVPWTHAVYRAYWAEDRDISDPAELARIAESVGLPADILARTGDPAVKEALKAVTLEARDKGLFGAPSFVVGDLVFWGQDRLCFVEKALAGWRPRSG